MFTSGTDSLSHFTEETLLHSIKEWLGSTNPPSPYGIGDDCAVFFETKCDNQASLIATDTLIFGKHFDETISAFDAGRKLTLRNLSDLAAMGASPKLATVALSASRSLSINWLAEFYRGIKDASDSYALKIVGGDLSSIEGRHLQAVMTITGSSQNPILRHSARVNDSIYVTGDLGGSISGKHYNFTPRLHEGQWLSDQKYATSMVDITDGIAKELYFLLAPKTNALIDLQCIPISKSTQMQCENQTDRALKHAFCDGEDYELLFTLSSKIKSETFEAEWAKQFPNVSLTKIGFIQSSNANAPKIIDQATQKTIDFGSGFEHF